MKVNFSNNFVTLRKLKGYTQESIAEKCGVSRQAITKWEAGSSLPDMYRLVEIADIFDVSIDELVCGSFQNIQENEVDYKELYFHRMEENKDIADIKKMLQNALKTNYDEEGELYQECLKYCEETDEEKLKDYAIDRGYFLNAINFRKLAAEKAYEDILMITDYLMTLGRGTSYVFFELIDVINNVILGDNSFNGIMSPQVVETAEEEIVEYVSWMRKIAERLPDYSRIILDEMDHMENDRTWSQEECEMNELV